MNDDQILRSVLIALLLVVLPIGIYYRLKSQATREKLDRRQEGPFILATLRPMGAVFWLGLIAWMIDPGWMAWSSVSLPLWLRWAAVGVIAVAGGLLVWTFRSLGSNLTDTVVTRQKHTLVLHGPYRWIRHPFYDSAALLTVAISLVAANWFLFVTGVALFGLLIIRTRTEEENLVARFGDSYRAYMERTGRFLPRITATRRGACHRTEAGGAAGLMSAAAQCEPLGRLQSTAQEMKIELFGLARKDWERVADSPMAFVEEHSLTLGVEEKLLRSVAEQTLALLDRTGVTTHPWTGFLAVDRASHTIVGTCGFKSTPDADGIVEIAYFTFPDFEGRGIASAMAAGLVESARGAVGVRRLRAHTMPEKNASTRVLEKVGFLHIGEVIDPEDGPVWRWERDPV